MKSRLIGLYFDVGRVLNNPEAFGLGEGMPKALGDFLTRIQSELMEELRGEGPEADDLLAHELSRNAERHAFPRLTSTWFELPKRET